MSAFEVSDETLHKCVALAIGWIHEHSHISRPGGCEAADDLGRGLLALNCESVRRRYPGEDDKPFPMGRGYRFPLRKFSRVECLKALDCWLYQSCEHGCSDAAIYGEMVALNERARGEYIEADAAYQAAAFD